MLARLKAFGTCVLEGCCPPCRRILRQITEESAQAGTHYRDAPERTRPRETKLCLCGRTVMPDAGIWHASRPLPPWVEIWRGLPTPDARPFH